VPCVACVSEKAVPPNVMTGEAIVAALRSIGPPATAVDVAERLRALLGERFSHSMLITYFKRSYPEIPLRTLLEAGGWHRVSGGGLSDDGFNELLAPWVPGVPADRRG